jgi:sigma-B regulation protein RsbU (phosphoserine phosphatase)
MMRGYGFRQRKDDFRSYSAGQVIFEEGQSGDEMFVVVEGRISITNQGRPINAVVPGSFFGEMALVDDGPRSGTATASVDSQLLPINQDYFLQLIQESPDFAIDVMSVMSKRLRRLVDEEVKHQRMEEELKIGRQIQESLLPDACPSFPGWEIAAFYRAARHVGGDLYDFIVDPEDPGRMHLVIADVTGKGVPAALYMASYRMTFRAVTLEGQGPAETLRRANRLITLDARPPLFLTAFYATLDSQTTRLKFANGGHEKPLWVHHDSGEVEPLISRGMVLGTFNEIPIEEKEITVVPGDYLVFFTDGLTEARDAGGNFFDDEGLLALLTSRQWRDTDHLLQTIVKAVDDFAGEIPAADDLTLVVVKRK